jgi:hypothetical protein
MNQGIEGQTKAERQGVTSRIFYYMGYETHIEGKHETHGFGQSNLTLTLIHIDAIRVVGAQLGLLGTLGFTWVGSAHSPKNKSKELAHLHLCVCFYVCDFLDFKAF